MLMFFPFANLSRPFWVIFKPAIINSCKFPTPFASERYLSDLSFSRLQWLTSMTFKDYRNILFLASTLKNLLVNSSQRLRINYEMEVLLRLNW